MSPLSLNDIFSNFNKMFDNAEPTTTKTNSINNSNINKETQTNVKDSINSNGNDNLSVSNRTLNNNNDSFKQQTQQNDSNDFGRVVNTSILDSVRSDKLDSVATNNQVKSEPVVSNVSGNLLNTPADFVDMPSTDTTPILDLTELENFDDPIEYMQKIEQMPSLEELLNQFSQEVADSKLVLNDEQADLLKTIQTTLARLDTEIDLKLIDQSMMAIMERLQENPEVINFLNPLDMQTVIKCFDRLYTVKTTATKIKREKKAASNTRAAKEQAYLASIDEDELDL